MNTQEAGASPPRRIPRARTADALIAFVALYGVSVLIWSWILMLALGAAGVDYSFRQCVLPWGLIMPLVLA